MELLLVLLLLSLASMIVLPVMDRGLREREVRQSALRLAAVARDLRGRAVSENALQRLLLSPSENSYQISPESRVVLPPDIKIARVEGGEVLGEGLRQFLFFSNGSLLGGEIGISSGAGAPAYSVRLDSLTGRVVVGRQ